MNAWLLILIMINPTTPHILTISVETYETEEICQAELEILTEDANGGESNEALICLQDVRLPVDLEPANEIEETWEGVCKIIPGDTIPCDDTILMAWKIV